ncbi:hypothetical protein F5Y16DRAFT_380970 [Xylariaceae sp. FL0255]|nr:hypothetical protein F5Y16DRAFT_380970 [Xylariaceae sp. FL0255]
MSTTTQVLCLEVDSSQVQLSKDKTTINTYPVLKDDLPFHFTSFKLSARLSPISPVSGNAKATDQDGGLAPPPLYTPPDTEETILVPASAPPLPGSAEEDGYDGNNNNSEGEGDEGEGDEEPIITEDQILDLATSSFPPAPSDNGNGETTYPPLPKPILIPRLDPGRTVPFARAWAPSLASHAVEKTDFVAFIDRLNVMMAPHLAFRLMQVASFAAGMVPHDVARGVSFALGFVAGVGAEVLHWQRLKAYMYRMNAQFFHPRKLHVKIIKTKRMKKLAKLDEKDPCLAPLTEQTLELSSQERCLAYLSQQAGAVSELDFVDVPPPSPATNVLAKLAAKEVRYKVRKADTKAKWGRKKAWKRHQKGKKLQEKWEGWGERFRVKALDWILVQNLSEWEEARAEKEARRAEARRTSSWRTIL